MTGEFRGTFEPTPDTGEFGTVVKSDGTIRPAGRPLRYSSCCGVRPMRNIGEAHYHCHLCGLPCELTLAKPN